MTINPRGRHKHSEAILLIQVSTMLEMFTKSIVQEMASKVDRPIFVPLPDSTGESEAEAPDLIAWTYGEAAVATLIPAAPVHHGGRPERSAGRTTS